LHTNKTNSETLKLTTRQVVNVTVLYLSEFKSIKDALHVVHLRASLDEVPDVLDRALHSPRDLVDILGLDHGLQVVFQDLGKVVYES
jgi:hypothetical protein